MFTTAARRWYCCFRLLDSPALVQNRLRPILQNEYFNPSRTRLGLFA